MATFGDSMPRYFFHWETQNGIISDDDGSELPDIAAAKTFALACVREMVADAICSGHGVRDLLLIADASGRRLGSVKAIDALPFSLRKGGQGSEKLDAAVEDIPVFGP